MHMFKKLPIVQIIGFKQVIRRDLVEFRFEIHIEFKFYLRPRAHRERGGFGGGGGIIQTQPLYYYYNKSNILSMFLRNIQSINK